MQSVHYKVLHYIKCMYHIGPVKQFYMEMNYVGLMSISIKGVTSRVILQMTETLNGKQKQYIVEVIWLFVSFQPIM